MPANQDHRLGELGQPSNIVFTRQGFPAHRLSAITERTEISEAADDLSELTLYQEEEEEDLTETEEGYETPVMMKAKKNRKAISKEKGQASGPLSSSLQASPATPLRDRVLPIDPLRTSPPNGEGELERPRVDVATTVPPPVVAQPAVKATNNVRPRAAVTPSPGVITANNVRPRGSGRSGANARPRAAAKSKSGASSTNKKLPQSILWIGANRQTASCICTLFKPEYEVIHVTLGPDQALADIPFLLRNETPPPPTLPSPFFTTTTNIGSRDYSRPISAIVISVGFKMRQIVELRESVENEARGVPWLYADITRIDGPRIAGSGNALVARAKVCLEEVESKGLMGKDGFFLY